MVNLKKGAIFGVECRALKKQFGKLFLVSMQSVDSQETHGACINNNYNLNKGAIFGVDARIAIMIFSILGVVGAYYSSDVISKAQEESLLSQVKTLRQAAMQNIIDNDNDYTLDNAVLNDNLFGIYVDSSSADLGRGRNNFAYINQTNPSATVGKTLISTPARVIEVDNKNLYSSNAATGVSFNLTDCADTLDNCYYWFKLDNMNEESFKLLDTYFDATAGTFADTPSVEEGVIVAPVIDTGNDIATVLVKVGER